MIRCAPLDSKGLAASNQTLFKNEASGTFMWALAGWLEALHFRKKGS